MGSCSRAVEVARPDHLTMMYFTLLTMFLATSLVSPMSQFTCPGVGYYPHPSQCTQYYICTDLWYNGQYQQYLFTCGTGTVWDGSVGGCNWPHMVEGCGEKEGSTTTSTSTLPTATTITSTSNLPTTILPITTSTTTILPTLLTTTSTTIILPTTTPTMP